MTVTAYIRVPVPGDAYLGVSRGAGARTASRTRCTTVQDMLLAGKRFWRVILAIDPFYRRTGTQIWIPTSSWRPARLISWQSRKWWKGKTEQKSILEFLRTRLCGHFGPATARERRHTLLSFVSWLRRLTRRQLSLENIRMLVSGIRNEVMGHLLHHGL